MYLFNLTLGQFVVLFGSVSAFLVALYLLDRSRRKQVVATLRFWFAAEQPPVVVRRKRIQQPLSLLLQLVSMALLLLAIAQLRLGARTGAPRDHVVILETSAWMSAKSGQKTLMDAAREQARAYIRAVPARDRIMLVRADALATPATAFEFNRSKLAQALAESRPGPTALNLEQALSFARHIQSQSGRRGGEIVFVGTGRIAERDAMVSPKLSMGNLRVIPVADPIENCGLRRVGLRRAAGDGETWEVYVSARNYGVQPHTVGVTVGYGASSKSTAARQAPVGAQRVTIPASTDRELTLQFRTRAAGVLTVDLLPHDGFPDDDHAELEFPALPALRVVVYSDEPDLLRPVLGANPRVTATYRRPAEYRAGSEGDLVILDRFRPPALPKADSIWIDPPANGSPVPIRSRPTNVAFARWIPDNPLGAGLRTRDFRLESASVFEAAPGDLRIGEVEAGPVAVAREGKPKIVVLGFNPALTAMRYELATPLLFANILRWMAPEIFRRSELSGGAVGAVKVALDPDVKPATVRVVHEDGSPVPFTLRDRSVNFFTGSPGTVRALAGDREYVYSLTLPQLWESKWQAPAEARHGVPKFAPSPAVWTELWHWLALAGAAGLIAEWVLFGRFRRGRARLSQPLMVMKRAS